MNIDHSNVVLKYKKQKSMNFIRLKPFSNTVSLSQCKCLRLWYLEELTGIWYTLY